MIGLGIVTYNRPEYFRRCSASVVEHLSNIVDRVVVVDDGSTADYLAAWDSLPDDWPIEWLPVNRGVGSAKNVALQHLLDQGCDWLFLSEDDLVIQDPRAVTGYIEACQASGYQHLMFHAHGLLNPQPQARQGRPGVVLWPNYVGAWCIYSRASLMSCGLFDESFRNAWEHLEHTLRLAEAGFTAPWRGAADAPGSEAWINEIPESLTYSVIRRSAEWDAWMAEGKQHWLETRPKTYHQVFG